ncbi:MAG: excinuclease ABC subunit UvrA [bacterium]|nr:excinuclease ABC subunit UvrA [bacterium]
MSKTKRRREPDRESATAILAKGIRVHNLKNVDVRVPHGKLVAVCGVSGSGKTSLALDTLYAEGQRRYIESFSAYTRQYLARLDKPDFDSIEGLPPALAVTRGDAPRGNRSTVGTASETLDYLRLLFANVSRLVCFQCGAAVRAYTPQSMAGLIESLPTARLMLGFSVAWDDVADRAAVLAELQNQGYVRLVSNHTLFHLGTDDRQHLAQTMPDRGQAIAIVDRLRGGAAPERTTESLEQAFEHGFGKIELLLEGDPKDFAALGDLPPGTQMEIDAASWIAMRFSSMRHCATCDLEYQDPQPRLFSFNSPLGACPQCEGFGDTIDLDWNLIVPDREKSISEGAIAPWNSPAYAHNLDELLELATDLDMPVDVPFATLSAKQRHTLMEGSPSHDYGGIKGFFQGLERKKYKMHVRVFISRWRSYNRCASCQGARLSPEALSYRIAELNLAELCDLTVDQLVDFLNSVDFDPREQQVAQGPLAQVMARLGYLRSVGLGYLQLSRPLRTLSGGEAQRTALTAALGSNLVNMLYVLDEPSVGLHPFDVERLTTAIGRLVERGNTVLVVEHEEALLRLADELIEVGPAAGNQGGEIVYNAPLKWRAAKAKRKQAETSLTVEFLTGLRSVPIPSTRRAWKYSLRIQGCTGNNLKSIDVEIPLGVLCVVTGVSGSGKSSLVQDTLYGALANRLTTERVAALPFQSITGLGRLDDCILVDQSPVSRSPRSNPVTYVKAFDEIRAVFTNTQEAKLRNYSPGHFSFNSELGRCPQCQGDGQLQIDMQFLADVHMACPSCQGNRYRSEILSVHYRERSIADVLKMTVSDAIHFFRGADKVQQKLKVLMNVGLGYLQLGQSATTLSSGEAQRLKLAGFLAAASRKRTLFLIDEPTTGLHPQDIIKLLTCFDALIDAGHSLLVVEHNTHLIAAADYLIDLGPGPGNAGGQIVATGTPEEVCQVQASITGRYLRPLLGMAEQK